MSGGMTKTIKIGCPSGFWGDSAIGAIQLTEKADLDYLMLDYLAEVTMSILVQARAKDPSYGYARDFITGAMNDTLEVIAAKGIKVVTNAGGVNPEACAKALEALCAKKGLSLKIATVTGDDVLPILDKVPDSERREMFSGAQFPDTIVSANAYLGAAPVAAALAKGADIVLTGRCVDSALALGVLMHEFGWGPHDWDRLAAGSLIGHILECGAQVTGGIHTDWDLVPDWANIGYPVAECHADGSFIITKPDGTGGLVTPGTVAEQMLYEIGDPATYYLPDVTADFSQVTLTQQGENRVLVDGARGRPATPSHKVSATWADGWRAATNLTIIGPRAVEKAQRTAEAIIERSRILFKRRGLEDFTAVQIELLGSESIYGPHARSLDTRETVMRIAVTHRSKEALAIFAAEVAPAGTNYAPGVTGYAGGRAKAQQVVRLFSMLVDKNRLPAPVVEIDGERFAVPDQSITNEAPGDPAPAPARVEEAIPTGESVTLPLYRLAYGRSGDKGDKANIAIIARAPRLVPLLRRELTAEKMKAYFGHLVQGDVERFEAPGSGGFNFLLDQALGGGGIASLRNDAQGKSYAQMALDMPVAVPAEWARDYA